MPIENLQSLSPERYAFLAARLLGRGGGWVNFRTLVLIAFLSGVAGCGAGVGEQDRRQSDHVYDMAYHLWHDQKDNLAAIRLLVQAVKLDPENADAHYFLGTLQLSRNELAEAEKHLLEALRLRERFPEAQNSLGVLYLMKKQYPQAEAMFQKAIDDILYREPWIARDNLARSYMDQGKYKEAVEVLKRAVFDQPQFCLGYFRMGQAYYRLGQDDAAYEVLKAAIGIQQPGCDALQEAYQLLGLLALRKGKIQDAGTFFQKCRDLGPGSDIGKKCVEEAPAPPPAEPTAPQPVSAPTG